MNWGTAMGLVILILMAGTVRRIRDDRMLCQLAIALKMERCGLCHYTVDGQGCNPLADRRLVLGPKAGRPRLGKTWFITSEKA
jgi:hypothetical protein